MPTGMAQHSPHHNNFSDGYVQSIFAIWYKSGKPSAKRLQPMITEPDPIQGIVPTVNVLNNFIKNNFIEQSRILDEEVTQNLSNTLVAEKIAMLQRHAKVAVEMQTMGLEYLRENGVGGARNAIQLLVEGLEIERGAVGAPQIAARMLNLSDEQLVAELTDLITNSPVIDVKPNDDLSG
jgi:hypothetical protein